MEDTERPIKSRRTGYGPAAAVLVTLGTYFASQVVIGLMVSLLPLVTGWSVERLQLWLDESAFAQFIMILSVEIVTLWLIWLFLQMRSVALKNIGLIKPHLRDIGYVIGGYIVYFALFIVISSIASVFIPGLNLEQEQEIGFSKDLVGVGLLFAFISLVILPPIAEEIIARGFLYTGLRSKLPKVKAAIITSILFAVAHLQWGSGNALLWVAALDTFVLSMILVYLREKTGSLWAPIGTHMLKNTVAFALLFIFKIA